MNRFLRTEMLLGPEAMNKLKKARVAVFGLGAVGSYAVEGLARSGIGHLRLIDFDIVKGSNINRQLYATTSTIGRFKTELAVARVKDINPDCRVEPVNLFVNSESVAEPFDMDFDVVIDAIDSLSPKVALITEAVNRGLFIVSSMGAATRTDPLLIRAGDISETKVCPLAKIVRKRLKDNGITKGVRCIYSIEPDKKRSNTSDIPDTLEEEKDSLGKGRQRKPLGSLSVLTGMFGLIAAREALFYIIER